MVEPVSGFDATRLRLAPVLLGLAISLFHAHDLVRHWDDVVRDTTPGARAALALRIGAAALELLLLVVSEWRIQTARGSWFRVRALAVYIPASALFAASLARAAHAAAPEAQLARSVFFIVLLVGTGLVLAAPPSRQSRPPRRAELFAFNALATCAVIELSLALFARVSPSPLLFGPSADARLAASRPAPASPWFGGRLNAGGYHDEPFFAAAPGDLVVAVIADSFGIGVVPYAENFVTIAEARLRAAFANENARVAIHNFGVPGIGLAEYAHLLETEVSATNPTLVALCIFVGNDITGDPAFGASDPGRFTLQDWLLVELPRRLLARRRAPEYVRRVEQQQRPDETGEAEAPDPPVFPRDAYLDLEARRLEVTDPASPGVASRYARFFVGLDWFREELDDRLVVVVFPDEFQVDDALWEQLRTHPSAPEAMVRDLPQQRITAWARERGARLVDTTNALRAANREAPVYALRNTHLDARGNRVVGELLASELLKTLEDRRSRAEHPRLPGEAYP